MIVVFIGPPGSGKGTQARICSDKLGLTHLSTGDVMREETQRAGALSETIKNYMREGKLVPDKIVVEAVLNRLEGDVLLDGFPRNMNQAEALDTALEEADKEVSKVVFFKLGEKELTQRVSSRLLCPNCGASYNSISLPPVQENICDQCGTELTRRIDDNVQIAVERLRVYDEETAPVVDYYKSQGKLEEVDASKSVDEVQKELESILGTRV